MGSPIVQQGPAGVWLLCRLQHGVVARSQLHALGYGAPSIKHRVRTGRLHPVARSVYAIGRPQLTRHGRWMAAVLSCGPWAVLSHDSAAALYGIRPFTAAPIEISVPADVRRTRPDIVVRRRAALAADVTRHHGIPVTSPACTLVDIAASLDRERLERAINEADKLDLVDPEQLRSAIAGMSRRPGLRALRETLDRATFVLTESELERRFVPLARAAGLSLPETGRWINGAKTDFYWPDLGLVVEADSLRYHRTPAQQTKDRRRDHEHLASGLTPLRFTHAQIAFEPAHVQQTLADVARRLAAANQPG